MLILDWARRSRGSGPFWRTSGARNDEARLRLKYLWLGNHFHRLRRRQLLCACVCIWTKSSKNA